jgi:hypothetical protein
VAYLNGSKVLTTGSALTFDGTNFVVNSPAGAGINIGYANTSVNYYDANTQIWRDGTFAEEMRLTSTGLGIGTSSPSSRLHIAGYMTSVNGGNSVRVGAAGQPDFNATGGDLVFGVTAGQKFIWGNSSNRTDMTLDSSGNLGIGTSSPTYKLDVAGQGRFLSNTQDQLTVGTTSTSAGASLTITAGNGTTSSKYSYLNFINSQSSSKTWRVGTYGEDSFVIVDGSTARLKLDSSGNLGLGVTPSAWGAYRALNIGSHASLAANQNGSSAVYLFTNVQGASTSDIDYGLKYVYTGQGAAQYSQYNGAHVWFTAPSGTAGNAISFTQAMTLDASGNLGVGTTSPIGSNNAGSITSGGMLAAKGYLGAHQTDAGIVEYNTNVMRLRAYGNTAGSGAIAFNTGGGGGSSDTERARIDSSGNLLVGTTSFIGGASSSRITSKIDAAGWFAAAFEGHYGVGINAKSATGALMYFYYNGGGSPVGNIYTNGSSTFYVTSSDYRLKENVAPMSGALARVAALKPCTYTWKSTGKSDEGFIAHELAEVCPEAVFGEKDAVNEDGSIKPQGIDTSFLTATLAAALQELHQIVKDQAAEIAALKDKLP